MITITLAVNSCASHPCEPGRKSGVQGDPGSWVSIRSAPLPAPCVLDVFVLSDLKCYSGKISSLSTYIITLKLTLYFRCKFTTHGRGGVAGSEAHHVGGSQKVFVLIHRGMMAASVSENFSAL